jgi:hypothetical protein
MAQKTTLAIYDQDTFKATQQMKIPNQGKDSDIEILHVTASHDDKKIGVTLGKRTIKNGYEIKEIVIYQRNDMDKFEIVKLRDFEYPEACYQFQFNKKNSDELLFITK